MARRRVAGLVVLAVWCAASRGGSQSGGLQARKVDPLASVFPLAATEVPERLSDQAFWRLITDASEPGGYFRSQDITNLTSNELWFQHVIPDLIHRTRPGGVYLGVGPEQNFTYMSALRPKLAVIFDIRRGNLDLQLMYKALFELAEDRAEFVSMLFGTPLLPGVTEAASASELFRALARVAPTDALHRQYLSMIEDRLLRGHRFALAASDLAATRQIYRSFYYSGIAVRPYPTYADLMTATDAAGQPRSFLASEAAFAFLRDLQLRNLVIPIVGDFSGPRAIRTVAAYLRPLGATVSAFYLSNVEQYLFEDPRASVGSWEAFCRNVASLPLDDSSTFIRSTNAGAFGRGAGFVSSLGRITEEVRNCRTR